MKPTAEQIEAAREFIKAMVGRGYFKLTAAFVDEHGEAGSSTMLVSLIAEREAAARDAAKREIHERIRETMMHPTVKDVPIPAALWHLMRNLEHETGDHPIGGDSRASSSASRDGTP